MSLAVTAAAAPREPAETRRLLLLIWAVLVATYLVAGASLSTDDAMRLVQVRDLLGGQSWFDLTQYRLSPPEGVAMHWSRLIDLPLAALIRAGGLVVTAPMAERFSLAVWPALLLLAMLLGIVRLARALADDRAARLALIFAALMAPVLQHFRPGAIDHHNVQLALLIWVVALVIRERPAASAGAGAFAAVSLAIGQEMAPAIAVVAAFVTIRWIVRGDADGRTAMAFGLSFAGATTAVFVATVAPAHYAAATCDALSIAQLAIAVCGGAGLAMLTMWRSLSTVRRRVAGAAALGEVLSTVVLLGIPACLGDPYAALDPQLKTLWLANVSEARSIFAMLRDLPQEVPAYYGLPLIGIGLGIIRCRRDAGALRWSWIAGTVVLGVTTLIALWQVRGSAAANALALVIVPAALVRMLAGAEGPALLGLGRPVLIAAALINPLALIAAGKAAAWTLDRTVATSRRTVLADGPGTCRQASDYTPLARLPQGLVLGLIDAGPLILMETRHAVLAAPYHRNIRGNAAMFDVFLGRPEQAVGKLAALGVDYVAFCPGAPERHNYAAAAPEGLAAALGRGEAPEGLERIALDGTDLAVYRRRR